MSEPDVTVSFMQGSYSQSGMPRPRTITHVISVSDVDEFGTCRRSIENTYRQSDEGRQARVSATGVIPVSEVLEDLKDYSHEKKILEHGFTFNTQWWKEELAAANWKSEGKLAADAPAEVNVSRSDLFDMASAVHNGTVSPEDFAFNVLLWGSGESRRNNRARIKSIVEAKGGEDLKQALDLSRSDVLASFDAFKPRGRNRFRYLGPAFFTKLMYFYGSGSPEHKPLIVDLRVLRTLSRTEAGNGIYVGHNYGVTTYTKALAVMEHLSDVARAEGGADLAGCTPDLVERWAFDQGGAPK
ncbi:hypothetical protein QO003_000829 [Arthrobacter silviterrae]|uniref:DUF3800 domain-containing protein n=1 Tax=Arthrobacter silviterrae TaxID=2026658 RepID=A0ABX0DE30_9MICC|nr:hypothetical protein [Arthrobacter silviterrae]MDQ0276526.1 hypothetical protein [Arthrobacter silviterrae]NGN85192.1 hypothetical protein [Arthrobacter silviterrae]